tara:strand:+ start:261 stop:620 length:360 start_codon:yes stop_codon:yes gene_type:complete
LDKNNQAAKDSSVKVNAFIDEKAQQLCYYLRGFWGNQIVYAELELFFWDILEEWSQVDYDLGQPYSDKERAFWHMLHQMHFWDAERLMFDDELVDELQRCATFLEGQGTYPSDCVGIRP